MPQQLLELGAEYLKQKRQREQDKNQNAMAKMRIEALEHEAQSYEDEQRGASDTMRQVAPIVAMWQDQAAQMSNETARANRRAAYSEIAALRAMTMREPGGQATMGDVLSQHKNMLRMQMLGDVMEGRPVDQFLASYAFGPESARLLPGAREAESFQKALEGEHKFSRQDEKEIRRQWQSEMNMIRRKMIELGSEDIDEDEILEQQGPVTARYISQMEDLGMTPTRTMYGIAGMEPPGLAVPKHTPESMALLTARSKAGKSPKPTAAQRMREQEGKPVYEGRTDITYGKAPTGLTPGEETKALREAYRSSIKEVFGERPSGEIEELINELISGQTTKVSGQPKYRARTEKAITEWKERERKRKRKLAMPSPKRRMLGEASYDVTARAKKAIAEHRNRK